MGQAFWTGVRLPSSPPASDRIAAMRFFFIASHRGNRFYGFNRFNGFPILGKYRFSLVKTPRRFHGIMRRTIPVEPIEPIEPAEPLSRVIKGWHAQGANPEPRTRQLFLY